MTPNFAESECEEKYPEISKNRNLEGFLKPSQSSVSSFNGQKDT